MLRVKKLGFHLAEVMVVIAVIGCLCVLGFSTFNRAGIDNSILSTKQARLENAVRTAALSIVNQGDGLSATQACNPATLKSMLIDKINNASEGENITIDGEELETIKVEKTGIIAIQTVEQSACQAAWAIVDPKSDESPVVLYAIPNENVTAVNNVPEKVKASVAGIITNSSSVAATESALTGGLDADIENDNSTPSVSITAFNLTSSSVLQSYEYTTPTLASASVKTSASSEETNVCEEYEKKHPEFIPTPNTKANACWNGASYTYTNPCSSTSEELQIYYNVNKNEAAGTCSLTYCEGNGIGTDGTLVTTGKVTNACASQGGNANQCACPNNRPFYISKYAKNGIKGVCVDDCCAVGMVQGSGLTCKCPTGTEWNATQNKCVKPGTCPEDYLVWDGKQCVCDSSKVVLADDEIYSSDVSKACREKCDTANYYFPNETRTECIRKLPECTECLKELNMTDYTCQCKVNMTNEGMVACNVPENQYYTGTGNCVQTCELDYKIRNINDITSCTCPATKPSELKLGNFEKYDTNSATCKSCGDVNVTNRVYDQSLVNCECLPSTAITFGDSEIYDITKANCKNNCPTGQVPDVTHTYCYVPTCADTLPSGFNVPAGKFYNPLVGLAAGCIADCPKGDYCPGTSGSPDKKIDPNPTLDSHEDNPDVPSGIQITGLYKCPCGYYGATTGLSATSCSGTCQAGYNCPKGSKSATQNKCTGSQLCKAGECNIEECSVYRQPDENHVACVCKSKDEITYKGDNWIYDTSETDCQTQCSGVLIRSTDKTQCVCPSVKPSTMVIPSGMHYDANAVSSGCLSTCPIGRYCPGTQPDYPDRPVVDPDDPDPYVDLSYPTGDVMKCLCGHYGSLTGNSKAKCNGTCYSGYSCPAGSTSPTQQQCGTGKICPAGSCGQEECISPLVPNPERSACICPASSAISLLPGYYYNSSVLSGSHLCQSKCPTTAAEIDNWIKTHSDKFTKTTSVYDSTAIGCISECTKNNYVASVDKLQCVCSLSPNTVPAGKFLESTELGCEYKTCPTGHYCPGSNPDPNPSPIPDPNYPNNDVIYCPCGTYGISTGLTNYACSGKCPAGYHCPTGTVISTQNKCADNQLCREGVCEPETCSQYRKPDANHTACVCKSATEITYKGANWVYDSTQVDCQYQCEGIKQRDVDNPTQCKCPSSKPSGYSIPAGKKYDPQNDFCISACPIGYYCPGTTGDVVNNDPDDTKKIPQGPDHPEVLKCICGYYGSDLGNAKAKCNGMCQAGYNCPAGSTSPTQNKCTGTQLCKAGVCEIQECISPLYPNPEQTQCICPASSKITLVPGYYYDASSVSGDHLCQSKCPTTDAAIRTWIANNQDKFTGKEKAIYDSNAVGCISTCQKTNFIASADRLACICGLSPNTVPAGKYLVSTANECEYKLCPIGHYCPGSNPDPNPSPAPDPNYPTGVIFCPCGNYASTEGLSTYACSGKCQAGYYCPQGSISKTGKTSVNGQEHPCSAGQLCQEGTCTPGSCESKFPLTSDSPYTSCSVCMSEAAIKAKNPNYFKAYEVYSPSVTTGDKLCKSCKSPRVYDASGSCVCPADKPYIYDDTCNKCQNWGTLFFARNLSSSEPSCTLYNFMRGDVSCFSGGKARRVDNNMKEAAEKLSSTDRNRTFQGVFAYMVAVTPDGKQASVVGTFTIDSWYAIFPEDEKAYNARTYDKNLVKGSCDVMCKSDAYCTQTCNYFFNNINSNTMTDNCKYVDTSFENRIGNSYGNAFDEFCSGGAITLKDGCSYAVGAFLRRYSSPLVLDLKGDGFKFTTVADGVNFDLNKDGYKERVSWTAEQHSFDNAFLVLDKNKNGQVDNGGELFGDQNGEENGFKELAKYDDNKDNVINKEDKIYSELLLWVDYNKNAKIDYDKNGKSKEIKTLAEANVTEISLDYSKKLGADGNILKDMYGNITGFVGSFKMMIKNAAGKLVETVRTMIDVFFMSA